MKHKILIIDDDESVLFVVKKIFEECCEVLTASGGEAGLEAIRRENPVFVFLDIKMPGMSGLEVLELLKDTVPAPLVWMLTGEEDMETAMRAMESGASGYITKPFHIDQLRHIVMSAIAARETKRHGGTPPDDKPWHLAQKKTDK